MIARGLMPLVLLAVAFASLVGCGGEQHAGGGEEVENLVRRSIAEAMLQETGKPSEAQVVDAAEHIDVTCKPARSPDYDCSVGFGELGERRCTVRPSPGGTKIESMRCGGPDGPPVTEEEYVDCKSVGPVVTVSDPLMDVTENGRAVSASIKESAEARTADLTAVRVAATEDRLCVEWETAAPIEPEYGLNFLTYPSGDQSRADGLSLSVEFDPSQPPDIGLLNRGSISGRVGIRDRRTSMLVKAGDLPEDTRAGLGESFSFAAHSARVIGRTHPDQAYGDDLSYHDERPRYP
jgi:hypothetical protein